MSRPAQLTVRAGNDMRDALDRLAHSVDLMLDDLERRTRLRTPLTRARICLEQRLATSARQALSTAGSYPRLVRRSESTMAIG